MPAVQSSMVPGELYLLHGRLREHRERDLATSSPTPPVSSSSSSDDISLGLQSSGTAVLLASDRALYRFSTAEAGGVTTRRLIERFDYREIYSVHRLSPTAATSSASASLSASSSASSSNSGSSSSSGQSFGFALVVLVAPTHQGKVGRKSNRKVASVSGKGELVQDYLEFREYRVDDEFVALQWTSALMRFHLERWQHFWEVEASHIHPPSYYQGFLFASKRNRKGKLQLRFLIVCSDIVHNVKAKAKAGQTMVDPGVLKWSMKLSGVKGITIYKSDPRLLTIQVDPAIATNTKKKVKPISTFLCGSTQDRDRIVLTLRSCIFKTTKKEMNVMRMEQLK